MSTLQAIFIKRPTQQEVNKGLEAHSYSLILNQFWDDWFHDVKIS